MRHELNSHPVPSQSAHKAIAIHVRVCAAGGRTIRRLGLSVSVCGVCRSIRRLLLDVSVLEVIAGGIERGTVASEGAPGGCFLK